MKKITFILIFTCFIYSCNSEKNDIGLKDHYSFPIGTAIKIENLLNDFTLQTLQKHNLNDWQTICSKNLEPKPAYFGFLEGLRENYNNV